MGAGAQQLLEGTRLGKACLKAPAASFQKQPQLLPCRCLRVLQSWCSPDRCRRKRQIWPPREGLTKPGSTSRARLRWEWWGWSHSLREAGSSGAGRRRAVQPSARQAGGPVVLVAEGGPRRQQAWCGLGSGRRREEEMVKMACHWPSISPNSRARCLDATQKQSGNGMGIPGCGWDRATCQSPFPKRYSNWVQLHIAKSVSRSDAPCKSLEEATPTSGS